MDGRVPSRRFLEPPLCMPERVTVPYTRGGSLMHSMFQRLACCCLLALGMIAVANSPASAGLDPYAVPTLSCESSTLASITLNVCGGSTGAPAGVTIQWKTAADFALNGWADGTDLCALSLSGQPSLQHPGASRWDLGAGLC